MGKRNKNRLLRVIGWGGVLFIFSVILLTVTVWLRRPERIMPDTSQWQTGDIFFSVGDSWKSVAVRTLTGMESFGLSDSVPSHCGIVVRQAGEVKLVHESTLAKRIVMESPLEYMENNGSFCLYARKSPCALDSADLRQAVDSLMDRGAQFDFDFDHSSPESFYCTELVVEISEICGCHSFSGLRGQRYIYPADILNLCVTP